MNRGAVGFWLLLAVVLPLAGCSSSVLTKDKDVFSSPTEIPPAPEPQANGSIYQGGQSFYPLFEDRRPRHAGDILTIVLNEQVSASKSSASSANRNGSASLTPDLLPKGLDKLGDYAFDLSGGNDFSGGGSSSANNTLTGTITVTVREVLPNGNLRVTGEKQIGINQGSEFIRFAGVVNPRSVTVKNTVSSTEVADAHIEYVGKGYISEAQRMGWLQRFFLNVSPF